MNDINAELNSKINVNMSISENNKNAKNRYHADSMGFAAFFNNPKTIDILFADSISDFQSFRKFPENIKHRRNILIYLTGLQILASLLSMLMIIIRKSFIYIFISLITFLLALSGIYGAIKINALFLIIHCVFTTSITGGFFFYQLLDLFFGSDTSYGNKQRFNDSLMLFIFSLPYLFDCCVGVYNYLFLKKVAEFNTNNRSQDLIKNESEVIKKKYTDEQISQYISGVDTKLCVICMNANRDTVLSPCSHVLCCEECAKSIFDKKSLFLYEAKCPICQRKCNSYMKVYIA